MTKKDFALIAKTIFDLGDYPQRDRVAIRFAKALQVYPNFNEDTFLKACVTDNFRGRVG